MYLANNIGLCLLIKKLIFVTVKKYPINDYFYFLPQNIDLPNKENENYTTSIHQLESENERLQSKIVKLQNDTETSLLPRLDTYEETEYTNQTQMEEKEER